VRCAILCVEQANKRHPGAAQVEAIPFGERAAMKRNRRGQRLIALACLGALLLNYPLLSIFNSPRTVWGVPLLYAYLFIIWALLISLLAVVVERG